MKHNINLLRRFTRIMGRAGVLVMALFVAAPASGQQQALPDNDDFIIANVQILGTNRAMGTLIYLSSDLQAGTTKDREGIQDALKRLWRLGMFKSIEILQDSVKSDSVYLTIQVEEHPKLNEFDISGNDELKTKDVRELVTMYQGQYISQLKFRKVVEKLKEEYLKKGYLPAEQTFEISNVDEEGALVVVGNSPGQDTREGRVVDPEAEGHDPAPDDHHGPAGSEADDAEGQSQQKRAGDHELDLAEPGHQTPDQSSLDDGGHEPDEEHVASGDGSGGQHLIHPRLID